jgi:hypothetical protein
MGSKNIPSGYDDVLNALMTWGRTGLIPNTKVVKSYFPPVQDPVTGARVLLPATVYATDSIGDRSQVKHTNIDTLPNTPYAGSSVEYNTINNSKTPKNVIADIGAVPKTIGTTVVNNEPGNAAVGIDSISSNYVSLPMTDPSPDHLVRALLNTTAGSDIQQSAESTNDQSVYAANHTAALQTTTADVFTANLAVKPQIVTSNLSDTQTLLSTGQLASGTEEHGTFTMRQDLDMHATRVPCAIPGVLNCYIVAPQAKPAVYPKYTYGPTSVPTYDLPDNMRKKLGIPTQSSTAPSTPVLGDQWWNTTTSMLYVWNGTSWVYLRSYLDVPYVLNSDPRTKTDVGS